MAVTCLSGSLRRRCCLASGCTVEGPALAELVTRMKLAVKQLGGGRPLHDLGHDGHHVVV